MERIDVSYLFIKYIPFESLEAANLFLTSQYKYNNILLSTSFVPLILDGYHTIA